MFFRLVTRVGQRKNSESPSDLRISRSDVLSLSHRDSTVSEVYYKVHMTHVLHTARISNVNSLMFVDRNREMVSFELGKEIKRDVFFLCPTLLTRSEVRFLMGTQDYGINISIWATAHLPLP